MPDLQSELNKVINSWDNPATAPASRTYFFKPTNNVSRETFNIVRDNPGVSRVSAIKMLGARGFKERSVSSLFVQFVRQGQMRESNNGLYVTQAEYTPLKSYATIKRKVAAAAAATPKPKRKYTRDPAKAAAKAAVYEEHENYNPTAAVTEFNAEDFVNGLTLKQAKAVYSELKKVFE